MIELIRKICCSICGQKAELSLPPPVTRREYSYEELYQLLKRKFPEAVIYLSDRTYKACALDDIAIFLEQDETNKMGYVPEDRDCDDFAYRLMGQFSIPGWSALTFGIVWTDKHALNCFVDNMGLFHFIEPQTDELQTELKEWQGTRVELIMI